MVNNLILFSIVAAIFRVRADFICGDGTVVHESNLCNGKIDCADGFDEAENMCSNLICPLGTFRCLNGGCITKAGRCNTTKECSDESDEKYCNFKNICRTNEFQCLEDSKCIDENHTCNGIKDCIDGSDESTTLCRNYPCPNFTFRCKYGECIFQNLVCDGRKDCIDGSDELKALCQTSHANITCKGIDTNRLETVCESNRFGHVPCNQNVPIGTIAKINCKDYYLPATNENNYVEIHCQSNGEWNGNVLKCVPDCGKINPGVQPLIIDGKNSTNWPWHAVMYLNEGGDWVASCGGTLISENAVLTAAHCVWKKSTRHMKFAFAKYYSDFVKTEDFTQIRDVKVIFTRPEYLDYRSNYGSDISVAILTAPVQFSEYVIPACLDWNLSNVLHLSENQLGSITGMGITGDDRPPKTLQHLEIPVISSASCIKKQKRDFKKYVTFTVFCAGWANGTSICNGDSGGGLLFRDLKEHDRWILQGIVSISPRRSGNSFCDAHRHSIFTKVSMYLEWLRDVVANIQS